MLSLRYVAGPFLKSKVPQYKGLMRWVSKESVKIGCASGFWGDTATAVPQLLYGSKLDFIMLDYLSELTMSLMAAARQKDSNLGYAPDFVKFAIGPHLKEIKKRGVRIVTNAGGINPSSCAKALREAASNADVDLKVCLITGDNLMNRKDELLKLQVRDIKSGKTLPSTVTTVNAYLGAWPIVEALNEGADIVLTGRCTDSALCLGPLIHKFGWKRDDWDKLAAGSLAGHLIECGAQATGGLFTDWHLVPNWENGGFPIAEVSEDGQIVITKPKGTGGLISWPSVAEQMVYEIDDPANYILPDVICDFTQVEMTESEGGVVITGAKGKPAPANYKVCATYADGYRSVVVTSVVGPKAAQKAKRVAESILARCRVIFKKLQIPDFTETNIQLLGTESVYGPHATQHAKETREVMTWIGVKHVNKMALQIFGMEVASAGTGMAPGFTAMVGGRPKPVPVLKLHSFLYPKNEVELSIEGPDDSVKKMTETEVGTAKSIESQISNESEAVLEKGTSSYRLVDLAYARSGDKGNSCNIGVIARTPQLYPYLKKKLTADVVKQYFNHLLTETSTVRRYELPGVKGLNFVLEDSLGGGGSSSLRSDPLVIQNKTKLII
ncbi:hypothetical protein CHUAL_001024 [Chamberlinius hualienensis]